MYQEVPASGNLVLLPLLLLLVVWCVCCLPLGGERTHLGRLGPMDKCMDEIKKGGVGTLMLKGASHSATATAISSTICQTVCYYGVLFLVLFAFFAYLRSWST